MKANQLSVVSNSAAPEPPYPSDTRAKGWRLELDYERIEQSDTWALATPEMRPWLLMIWLTAWKQAPCGSLPANDLLIAARIGMPDRQFAANRDILLRGWWLASDGRLYHPALTDHVVAMGKKRRDDATRVQALRKKAASVHAADGGCVYCGSSEDLTLDHILPLRLGGTNDDNNLASACRSCNSRKRGRTPEAAGMRFVSEAAAQRWSAYKQDQQLTENVAATRRDSRGVAATTTPEPVPVPEPTFEKQKKLAEEAMCDAPRSASAPPKAGPKPKPSGPKGIEFLLDAGVDRQVALDWLAIRLRKRLPLTSTAWAAVVGQAESINMTPGQAVKRAVEEGWAGFKADWVLRTDADRGARPGAASAHPAATKQSAIEARNAETARRILAKMEAGNGN